jgi:hypothetical protein
VSHQQALQLEIGLGQVVQWVRTSLKMDRFRIRRRVRHVSFLVCRLLHSGVPAHAKNLPLGRARALCFLASRGAVAQDLRRTRPHTGYSYAVFCKAVRDLQIKTSC